MSSPAQRTLPFGRWSRKPRKRGRKTSARRPRVPHTRRPVHCERHPLHVTVRMRSGLPSLRSESMFRAVFRGLFCAKARFLRIVHWSVQSNHIHLLVEAHDRGRLTQGMKGFGVRVAKAVNRLLGVKGGVWADRYHARPLTTPREVRNVLVYVLCNHHKHGGHASIDRCSSGPYFRGWAADITRPPPRGSPEEWPVSPASTWLADVGWRRLGPIGGAECPA